MRKIRVGVVDDSAVCRVQLRDMLEAEGDIEVVAEASDGDGVIDLLITHRVQLLTVDLQMPRVNGHETITRVMACAPLPILVLTGMPLGLGREALFESIRRGALDLAEKPSLSDIEAQWRLREAVRRLASIPVVRHVAGHLEARSVPAAALRPSTSPRKGSSPLVVAIAASAGGPAPLATLLGALAPDLPASVLVVQHLPRGFAPAFVDFLATRTHLRVTSVSECQPLRPGHLYVAGGDFHFGLVAPDELGPLGQEPSDGHVPSADRLFSSVAAHAGSQATGIVLSGMGDDGKQGLLELQREGGLCLAQDQQSCAVWGMPRAALEAGAVERTFPPLELADVVTTWVQSRRSAFS